MNINKIKYCIAVAILVIATAFCGCGSSRGDMIEIERAAPTDTSDRSAKDTDTVTVSKPEKIRVYVCGAVARPDVYTLDPDVRMIDAVNAAGGFRADAAADCVNLASRIKDGEKIYIPTEEEIEEAFIAQSQSRVSGETGDGKVNINTADKAALMTLPGVGESKADKIIDFRQTNGGFSSIEDIMLVAGIKEGMYNKIKDKICVD